VAISKEQLLFLFTCHPQHSIIFISRSSSFTSTSALFLPSNADSQGCSFLSNAVVSVHASRIAVSVHHSMIAAVMPPPSDHFCFVFISSQFDLTQISFLTVASRAQPLYLPLADFKNFAACYLLHFTYFPSVVFSPSKLCLSSLPSLCFRLLSCRLHFSLRSIFFWWGECHRPTVLDSPSSSSSSTHHRSSILLTDQQHHHKHDHMSSSVLGSAAGVLTDLQGIPDRSARHP
jgi:hypothetical protein